MVDVFILQGQGLVSVADVPVRDLSTVGRFESCSYPFTVCLLCCHLLADVVHDLLHERGGVLVVKEHAVCRFGEFVCHVFIIGADGAKSIRGGTDPELSQLLLLHIP